MLGYSVKIKENLIILRCSGVRIQFAFKHLLHAGEEGKQNPALL